MEIIEMTATSSSIGKVRVFLNGEEVTDRAWRARVPAEAGVEGDGEIEMWVYPLTRQADGKPKSEIKTGRVYWVRKASTM